MERSSEISALSKALALAQGELKAATMDSKNPHFNSKYASLASIQEVYRPVMSKHGLAIVQGVLTSPDGHYFVETMVSHESGQFIIFSMKLLIDKQHMQGLGSAITYAKRYSISSMLGISADEDDDGNAASSSQQRTQKPPANRPPASNHSARPDAPRNNVAPASAETLDNMAGLCASRGVGDQDLETLVVKGYGWTSKQLPDHIVKEIIALLSVEGSGPATVMAKTQELQNRREMASKNGHPQKVDDFVMPIGSEDVKGKKLIELSEGKLQEILTWCKTEVSKTPPPPGIARVIEVKAKIEKFLGSMGVKPT